MIDGPDIIEELLRNHEDEQIVEPLRPETTAPSEEPTVQSEEPTVQSEETTAPSEEPTAPSEEPTAPSEAVKMDGGAATDLVENEEVPGGEEGSGDKEEGSGDKEEGSGDKEEVKVIEQPLLNKDKCENVKMDTFKNGVAKLLAKHIKKEDKKDSSYKSENYTMDKKCIITHGELLNLSSLLNKDEDEDGIREIVEVCCLNTLFLINRSLEVDNKPRNVRNFNTKKFIRIAQQIHGDSFKEENIKKIMKVVQGPKHSSQPRDDFDNIIIYGTNEKDNVTIDELQDDDPNKHSVSKNLDTKIYVIIKDKTNYTIDEYISDKNNDRILNVNDLVKVIPSTSLRDYDIIDSKKGDLNDKKKILRISQKRVGHGNKWSRLEKDSYYYIKLSNNDSETDDTRAFKMSGTWILNVDDKNDPYFDIDVGADVVKVKFNISGKLSEKKKPADELWKYIKKTNLITHDVKRLDWLNNNKNRFRLTFTFRHEEKRIFLFCYLTGKKGGVIDLKGTMERLFVDNSSSSGPDEPNQEKPKEDESEKKPEKATVPKSIPTEKQDIQTSPEDGKLVAEDEKLVAEDAEASAEDENLVAEDAEASQASPEDVSEKKPEQATGPKSIPTEKQDTQASPDDEDGMLVAEDASVSQEIIKPSRPTKKQGTQERPIPKSGENATAVPVAPPRPTKKQDTQSSPEDEDGKLVAEERAEEYPDVPTPSKAMDGGKYNSNKKYTFYDTKKKKSFKRGVR